MLEARALVLGGLHVAILSLAEDLCGETSGREPSPEGGQKCARLVREARERELAAWKEFSGHPPVAGHTMTKITVGTCRASTWKVMDGKTNVRARLAIKGLQDPDLRQSLAETAGCVRLRPSHLQLRPPGVTKKWKFWSLNIKNAFL